MNIIVIHGVGVDIYKSWTKLKLETSYVKEDFEKIGSDYVLNTSKESYEIAKDIKLLEHVAAKKMFTKNKMDFSDIITMLTFFLVIISLAK